jgi:hypothetical protein
MAKRYKHVASGAVVSVRDDKVLGSEWVDLSEPAKELAKEPAPRRRGKASASSEPNE